MNLLIEYFVPSDEDRHIEYLTCLRNNINNPFITKIHVFIDDDSELPEDITSDKIVVNHVEKRATYKEFFEYANKNLFEQTCILSNGDIMFDDTLMHLTPDNVNGKFVSLSRWELTPDGKLYHYDIPYSQDCWIFKGGIEIKDCDFTLGVLGCDNRITYLAMRSGLVVTNPSKQVITKHLHISNFRQGSADVSKMITGMYIFVDSNNDIHVPSENYVVSPNNVRRMVNHLNSKKQLRTKNHVS
ncbi:MAG: putative polypeptide N-acetylgalactosaminyltransferase [uncultured marine phage]|uniref:Putative polypeptide N-acetylgalactosaminyltransferase n=1 Tax=uncultured marine phage TaxID=707152 RepID=A0A8D9CFW2_9VIRU|nr:MAG: putative polypeptide N-acetylgalactosaminyltransferase [uncultured marine phage]